MHFRDSCTVGDAAGKLIDLMQTIFKFELEMENDYQLALTKGKIAKVLKEDSFDQLIYVVWLISFILNLFTIFFYGYEGDDWSSADAVYYLETLFLIAITVTALLNLVVWFFFKYESKVEIARTLYPTDSNVYRFTYLIDIYIYKSVIK